MGFTPLEVFIWLVSRSVIYNLHAVWSASASSCQGFLFIRCQQVWNRLKHESCDHCTLVCHFAIGIRFDQWMCEYPGPEAKVGANRASCCGQRTQSERVLSKDGGQKFAFDAFPNFVCRGKYMQIARILSLSASVFVCPCYYYTVCVV